ncbi:MAG: hypothetical protein WCE58_13680 [Gallionella sp.]
MPNKPKSLKQKFRQLAGIAYERELAIATEALHIEFQRWKNDEIDVFELNDRIHGFHNGISRELYSRYSGNELMNSICVSSALHKGVLSRDEVGEEVFLAVEGKSIAGNTND